MYLLKQGFDFLRIELLAVQSHIRLDEHRIQLPHQPGLKHLANFVPEIRVFIAHVYETMSNPWDVSWTPTPRRINNIILSHCVVRPFVTLCTWSRNRLWSKMNKFGITALHKLAVTRMETRVCESFQKILKRRMMYGLEARSALIHSCRIFILSSVLTV